MEETQQIEPPLASYRTRKITLAEKVKLLRGKLFRFYVGHFNKSYVKRNLALRQGECQRCGACCHLLHRCAFALECKEGAGCRIYLKRPVNCRIFPLNQRDLSERDIMMPEQPCGYHFDQDND